MKLPVPGSFHSLSSPIRSFNLDICTRTGQGYALEGFWDPSFVFPSYSFFYFYFFTYSFFFFFFLPVLTDVLFFFVMLAQDSRWGNTSIVFRFSFSRISYIVNRDLGNGRSIFFHCWTGERRSASIGLHRHAHWMGVERTGIRWGRKYVRCTLYYCLVSHFGLVCAWNNPFRLFVTLVWLILLSAMWVLILQTRRLNDRHHWRTHRTPLDST